MKSPFLKPQFITGLLLGLSPVTLPGVTWAQSSATSDVKVSHEFIFVADSKLNSVNLAGTFNNWDKNATPLKAHADGLTWRLKLPLSYGKIQYKFVLNGETWVVDPTARNEGDGNGNTNSILMVLPPDYQKPASPNDGVTAKSALLHQEQAPYFNFDRGKLMLSLRARPNDLKKVQIKSSGKTIPMQETGKDELYTHYEAELPWNRTADLTYLFQIQDGNTWRNYGANGLSNAAKPFTIKAKSFKPYEVPSWVEQTIFYQIFPDRFANGDKSNDPQNVQPWDATPTAFSRFGGDVAGVSQHLSYLENLGINGVYFNPVFKSPSNHRYDAEDFKTLDPEFGTNAEFSSLTRELKNHGIRTVMDFVFNHTATTFAPFYDIREKGEASDFRNWYFIKSYPVKVQENPNYVAWFNYPSMPKLNLMNPATRDYMLNLVNYWKKEVPLAGLRLDVANEVDPRFWRALRQRAKGLDPQTWIVGEVWGDGSPWLTGDQWDSVMNYQFRDACIQFFADGKTSPSQFTSRLMNLHHSYVPQVSRNMMNLLSSHDTPRFLTLCKNDEALHRLAATVQFTWEGAPSIYYGEELGMQGGADPDNRRGMRWDLAKSDNPMLSFYRQLIAIRRSSRVLQSGTPSVLMADDNAKTLAYARTLDGQMAIVAMNRSAEPRTVTISLPSNSTMQKVRVRGFTEAFSKKVVAVGQSPKLNLTLAPMSSQILLSR